MDIWQTELVYLINTEEPGPQNYGGFGPANAHAYSSITNDKKLIKIFDQAHENGSLKAQLEKKMGLSYYQMQKFLLGKIERAEK